ncbi:MAG: hypothetical protein WA364_11460 [Candidatus Nitrosopolaris sp.]
MTENLTFEHGKWKATCPHCGKDISKIVNEAATRCTRNYMLPGHKWYGYSNCVCNKCGIIDEQK